MLNYVDGFSCSLNQSTKSIVIHFTQKEPVVKEADNIEVVLNPITSIIMEQDSAKALLSLLNDIYADDEHTETE